MAKDLIKGNKVTYTLECRRGNDLEQDFDAAVEVKGTLKLSSKEEIDPVDIEVISPSVRLVVDSPSTGFVKLTFLSTETNTLVVDEIYDLAVQLEEVGGDFIEFNDLRAVQVVKQVISNA